MFLDGCNSSSVATFLFPPSVRVGVVIIERRADDRLILVPLSSFLQPALTNLDIHTYSGTLFLLLLFSTGSRILCLIRVFRVVTTGDFAANKRNYIQYEH